MAVPDAYARQRVRGWGIIEENHVGELRLGVGKRIGLQDRQHFGCRAHNDGDSFPRIGMQPSLERGLHP